MYYMDMLKGELIAVMIFDAPVTFDCLSRVVADQNRSVNSDFKHRRLDRAVWV